MAPSARPPLPDGDLAALARSSSGSAEARREPFAGWLMKRKRKGAFGAAGRALTRPSRRFFTIDFEGPSLYYAHSETNKQVSRPMPIKHIARVEVTSWGSKDSSCDSPRKDSAPKPIPQKPTVPEGWTAQWVPSEEKYFFFNEAGVAQWDPPPGTIEAAVEAAPEEAPAKNLKRSNSKTSVTSGLSFTSRLRLPGFGRKKETEQHGFVLHMKDEGKLELICSSKSEAEEWISMFGVAMRMASSRKVGGRSSSRSGGEDESTTDGGSGAAPSDSDDEGERPAAANTTAQGRPAPAADEAQAFENEDDSDSD